MRRQACGVLLLLTRVPAFLISNTRTSLLLGELKAVSKKQTCVYDGAEFMSITGFLLAESQNSDKYLKRWEELILYDTNAKLMPPQRAGYMTFVAGTNPEKERVLGIQADSSVEDETLVWIDDTTAIYQDSMAKIPKQISDVDAIATAAAALCGVHCGMPHVPNKETPQAVVLGGGDYAVFTAQGLCAKGAKVSLVTSRMKSLANAKVQVLAPVTTSKNEEADDLGFADAMGKFHSVIDTLGDEANLMTVDRLSQCPQKTYGGEIAAMGIASSLHRDYGCQIYVSAFTKSQNIAVEEGLLFGRNAIKQHQQQLEKTSSSSATGMLPLAAPLRFGSETLQPLLDQGIVFCGYKNEVGNSQNKQAFVRGWSFSDFSESAMWPRYDSTATASVRFGFPTLDEDEFREEIDEPAAEDEKEKPEYAFTTKEREPTNPYVLSVPTLADLDEHIVQPGHDCVLFVSAHYCKLCASLKPEFTRMARLASEASDKDAPGRKLVFANANTKGKLGRQFTDKLGIDFVPNFILFKAGKQYDQPLGALKLPSDKLDLAVKYLTSERMWDMDVFEPTEDQKRTNLKRNK